MRFSVALVSLLSTQLTSARGLFGGSQEVVAQDDDLKIPGDSPLELCDKSHDDDIVSIESVDLLPNPPEAGTELVIKAVGTVYETIEDGAYVVLQVKYGLIRLISTTASLCEQIKNVDMECPIEPGILTITKSVDLPKEIPPGKYNVFADVYTKDGDPITCLTASVVFGKKSALGGILDL